MRGGRQRKRAAKEEKVGNRNGSDPCVDPIYDLVGSLFQKEGGGSFLWLSLVKGKMEEGDRWTGDKLASS